MDFLKSSLTPGPSPAPHLLKHFTFFTSGLCRCCSLCQNSHLASVVNSFLLWVSSQWVTPSRKPGPATPLPGSVRNLSFLFPCTLMLVPIAAIVLLYVVYFSTCLCSSMDSKALKGRNCAISSLQTPCLHVQHAVGLHQVNSVWI